MGREVVVDVRIKLRQVVISGVRQVVIMGKVMILSFSEDEEDICQRMLQIISQRRM